MSRISVNRKKVKLKGLLGIRARLVLLALILVAPLMLDRVRSLETTRAKQVALTSSEFSQLAEHSAEAQREVIASVQAVLKSAAYIHASAARIGRGCAIMRASLQVDLPWIRTLSAVGKDGKVLCSTLPALVGMDLSDRSYFKKALETHDFVLSDYLFSRGTKQPGIAAAYPVSAVEAGDETVMVAAINLDWMSQIEQPRRPARRIRGSRRQQGHGAGDLIRSSQHDRSPDGKSIAAVCPCGGRNRFGRQDRIDFGHGSRWYQARGVICPGWQHRIAPGGQHR
jgi:hypothetical protein